jgi:hypothetical protein
LLTCGCCGGGYTIMAKDRYGCATRRGKGTCSNDHTITRQAIEARVLDGLRERMLSAELIAEFVRVFTAELTALQQSGDDDRRRTATRLGEVERRLQGVLRAVENGAWNDSIQARLNELEQQKRQLLAEQAEAEAPPARVHLHPNAAEIYRAKVADLQASLAAPAIRVEAAEALRSMIARVVLTPDDDAPDRLRAELHGELATILQAASGVDVTSSRGPANWTARNEKLAGTGGPGSQLPVVAGTRSHLYRMRFVATSRPARASR